jgi:iron complex outermembrane receptor protein
MATAKLVWDPAPGHKISFSTNLYWSDYGYKPFHTYLFNPKNGDPITSDNRQLIGPGQTSWFTGLSESNFLSSEGRSAIAIYNLSSENKLTDTTTLKLKGGLVNNAANYYVDGATDYFTSRGTVHNTPSKNYNFEGQIEQLIGKKQVLTAGLTYATGFASTTDWTLNMFRDPDSKTDLVSYSEGKDRLAGFYLQDEINWHPKFNTVIGGRLDFWKTYEGKLANFKTTPKIWHTNLPSREQVAFNPKIAFLYRPWECLTWRASVGTAFRPPNIYELYRTTTLGRTIYKGNPFLKPETSLAWEVGATLQPFQGNVISATFFDSYIDDLIYVVTDPRFTNVRNRENAGKARIYGVELEVTQRLFSWLDVFANMTLTDPRVVKNPKAPLSVNKQLTSSPREQVNFGINLQYWKVNANLSGRYVSKVYGYDDNSDGINNTPGANDPYFVLNTKVTLSPVPYADISLSVDNIFNRQYYNDSLTPGRMCWVEAKLKY